MASNRQLAAPRRAMMQSLIALLLVAQGLVPTGFMPAYGTDGLTLTLCTGQGSRTVAMPENASPAMIAIAEATQNQHSETDEEPPLCDFAALSGTAMISPGSEAARQAPVSASTVFAQNNTVSIGAGLAAPPPPATGPPLPF